MENKEIKILDCTLRDGGYYNAWDFDDALIEKYIKATNYLPLEYIEIGYRSNPQKQYLGKLFYLPEFAIKEIYELSNKKIAVMLNEKDTAPEDVNRLLKGLDKKRTLMRIAVNPENFERALVLGKKIKKEGFNITFNVIYMSKYYNNQNFLLKLKELNGLVTYLNLVDSYGGMNPTEVSEMILNVKKYCKEPLGFHGHNNIELAFANTLSAIEAGCEIVDSTIMGMGRGAGNLKTELLLTYLASKKIIDFDFNTLSSLIEDWEPLEKKYNWGTSLPYMVSGSNSLPQKEVMDWVQKRYYSFNSIIRVTTGG